MATGFDAAVGFDSAAVTFDGSAVTQFGPSDLRVELFLKTSKIWSKITSAVKTEEGVTITRGRQAEGGAAVPSSCRLTLNNPDGNYSPRNTAGTLYGQIGRNTPLRVGLGSPVLGITKAGTGSTVTYDAVSESASYGSTGVFAVAYAAPQDTLTTPAGYSNGTETDATAFTIKSSTTTDSGALPSTTSTASGTPTAWLTAHLVVPGGTFDTRATSTTDTGNSCVVDYSAAAQGGKLATAVCFWPSDTYGRMQPPGFREQTTHTEMYLVSDSGPSTGPRVMVWAWLQDPLQDGQAFLESPMDGAQGCGLTIAWWTGASTYSPRFVGEVADWPQAWNKPGQFRTVPLEAGGALRRMAASQDLLSPLRAAFLNGDGLLAYWPLEDAEGTVSYAPSIGGFPMVRTGSLNTPAAGVGGSVAGSLPLPDFDTAALAGVVSGSSTTSWGFGAVAGIGPTVDLFPVVAVGSDLGKVTVLLDASTTEMALFVNLTSTTSSLTTEFPGGLLGRQALVYCTLTQSGADVNVSVKVTNITPGEAVATNTKTAVIAGVTLGKCTKLLLGTDTTAAAGDPAVETFVIGHAFVTSGTTLSSAKANAGRGFDGVGLSDAARDLCRNAGFLMNQTFDSDWETIKAGPSPVAPIGQNLADLEQAGQALLNDSAGFVGVDWRPYTGLISQASIYDLALASVTGDLHPNDDDTTTVNDATVQGLLGSGHVIVSTGALGAQAGGIGRYSTAVSLPVNGLAAASDLAGWLTHVGTLDAARWPEVTIAMEAAATLSLPLFSIGDVVNLTGLPSFTGPSSVKLQVTGLREEIDPALYRVTLVCRLDNSWRVLIWDDATYGVWADSAAPANTDSVWGMS